MGTQFLSYCISVGIDLHYRSTYRRLRAEEAALAAATAERKVADELEAKDLSAPASRVGGYMQFDALACWAFKHPSI